MSWMHTTELVGFVDHSKDSCLELNAMMANCEAHMNKVWTPRMTIGSPYLSGMRMSQHSSAEENRAV